MTFEEIREMVNATITENGKRQITGKALNLALLEMITAMEENKPEGSGAETVFVVDNVDDMSITPEHQAANAAVYAKCRDAAAEGKPLPMVCVDGATIMLGGSGVSIVGVSVLLSSSIVMFVDPNSELAAEMSGLVVTINSFGDNIQAVVAEDGSVTLVQ